MMPRILALLAALLTAGFWSGASAENRGETKHSAGGHYRVSLTAKAKTPWNAMQSWRLGVTRADGTPVRGAAINITGGTLDHVHALPTRPRISAHPDGGYRVEGVKFDRQGRWQLHFDIRAGGIRDQAQFEVQASVAVWASLDDEWTKDELTVLRSLWIGSLPKPPPDPTNAVADDARAAEFGHRLFFDNRLSANGQVACVTCHIPELAFTDGRKNARGVGLMARNAPTIIGAAYSPWQFWDGRKDSQWAQAMGPLESAVEHGTSRDWIIGVASRDLDYRRRYEALFGPLPAMTNAAGIDAAFANLGKAIAAYERTILPAPTKFDRYVEAVLAGRTPAPADQFSIEEIAGLRVFISDNQGQCIRCHNGPMFTDNHFHNIGSQVVGADADEQGRSDGIKSALADAANCRGAFSDAPAGLCAELRFAKRAGAELAGAFKTPTLRYVVRTAPYMHAGQFQTLEDAIWQYRDVPPATVGETELTRLPMSDAQFRQIEDFLKTLDGPIRAPEHFLKPPN
ncbi:MAG: methylamine utilization protein [Rhodospirillaceae bacterium]|nr:methylamine utilization protein [Rhodospirillaceae bacterium]